MKQALSLLIFSFFTTVMWGQPPKAFNYQGVARDLAGMPIINQEIGLRIAILSNSAQGVEIYKETQSPTTNNLGLFNVHIGIGTPVLGIFDEIDWGSDIHFIQIEIDASGGTNYSLIGTSQLLSVPYALYAGKSGVWKDFEEQNPNISREGIRYDSDNSSLAFNSGSETGLSYPNFSQLRFFQDYTDNTFGNIGLVGLNFIRRVQYNDEPTLEFAYSNSQGTNRNFAFRVGGEVNLFLKGNGFLGIGTSTPSAKVHIEDGDIYLEDVNSGVIMKSSNGQCWRYTPDENGQLIGSAVTCPN